MEKRREENQRESTQPRIKETEFPKDLNDRMEAILSSFNASPKAVTLLLLSESMIDPASLSKSLKETIAGSEMGGTTHSPRLAADYCRYTLTPIGLVAEETKIESFGKEEIIGFSLTKSGKEYGQPLAALLLDFETKNGFSVFPILGLTRQLKGERRAPFTRYLILKELLNGEMREKDLFTMAGVTPQTVGRVLDSLNNAGVVEYSSVKFQTDKEEVEYELAKNGTSSSDLKTYRYGKISEAVMNACTELSASEKIISQKNIYDLVPEEIKIRWKPHHLRIAISHILSGLEKQDYLKRGKFKGGEIQSNARLTEKGRLFVQEFLIPLEDALSDGPALARLREDILPKVTGNLNEYARKTANLYYPYSTSSKMKESEDYQTRVLSILQKSTDEGITARDLAEKLGLHPSTTGQYLRNLLANGESRRENRKGVFYYFPVNPSNKPSS